MARISQQPAYVLHTRAYRESSLLVEALSRDYGRVAMVARGARGARSRQRNTLQPFRPLLLSWGGRGDLATLMGGEQVAAPPPLHGEALYCGLYVNELLMRFLHRADPHPEVFESYRDLLGALAGGAPAQPLLRVFERDLLEAVGYGMGLDQEYGSGVSIRADRHYLYQPGRGARQAAAGAANDGRVISGRALLALNSGEVGEEVLPELRRLMREVIGYHAGERPLKSQALILGLRRYGRGGAGGSDTEEERP